MERQLATVRRISELRPIDGADRIELAIVDGWQSVVKKGEFQAGDLACYLEVDSFLPLDDKYEFLRASSYRKMPGAGPGGVLEGFRLKTMKMRGEISQGLLLPLEQLPGSGEDGEDMAGFHYVHPVMRDQTYNRVREGADLTWRLCVVKYDQAVGRALAGTAKGNFPEFIPKTDEERIQNLGRLFHREIEGPLYVAEKLDGSSMTVYLKDGLFGVCSRNLDLAETEGSNFWKVARRLGLEAGMRGLRGMYNDFAVQGELIGPGIQGNKYGLLDHDFRVFSVFDVGNRTRLGLAATVSIAGAIGAETVPILDDSFSLPETAQHMLAYAEGKSALNSKTEREGVVVRSHCSQVSFKAISNKFLLKED